jgi:hypothetical protein
LTDVNAQAFGLQTAHRDPGALKMP